MNKGETADEEVSDKAEEIGEFQRRYHTYHPQKRKRLPQRKVPALFSDDLINAYSKLIVKEFPHIYVFDTQFYKNLEKNGFDINGAFMQENTYNYSTWIVPIQINDCHWILLKSDISSLQSSGRLYFQQYDSLKTEGRTSSLKIEEIYKYVENTFAKFQGKEMNNLKISVQNSSDIPQQTNDFDCGSFLLAFILCIAADKPFTFTDDEVFTFRCNMKEEIMKQKLNKENSIFQSFSKVKNCQKRRRKRTVKCTSLEMLPKYRLNKIKNKKYRLQFKS